jgi:CAAX protease family protein
MRPLRALVIYIVVVFVGGALIAPWLYWLAQSFSHTFPHLAASPFHRFVNRSLLGLALVGLWPLLKSLGAESLCDAGLIRPAGQWKRLFGGFALGFVSLAMVVLIVIAAGGRQIDPNLGVHLAKNLSGAAVTAAAVAVLEEILFRGGIFGGLRKVFDWRFALVLSSMIYAILHFMESAELKGAVTWLSGLELFPRMLGGLTDVREVIPGFFNLTLAGILLGWAYQRTGNLYFSIGLHAGWIFWLNFYHFLTNPVPGASEWLWGSRKLIDGWLALLALSAALLIFSKLPLERKREPLV